MSFYLTRRALSGFRLSISRLIQNFLKDLTRNYSQLRDAKSQDVQTSANIKQFPTPISKPIIFASYCAGKHLQGYDKFCGGDKELNYLVKLLRERGYEAYMVSYDGNYEPWLLDHQPYLSLDKFRCIVEKNTNVRCVTSWAHASAFIQLSPSIYFWDMELAHTQHAHFPELVKLYRKKIANTAAISRTIQAWHMANFQRACTVLPNLIDTSLWLPLISNQNSHRVGYMHEGSHTQEYLDIVRSITYKSGLEVDFFQVKGVESEVMVGIQSCKVFLSMNKGKDQLWGEGCPRTVIEALSVGSVVIAFDVIGNRETILNNYNGVLVPRYRPDLMAEALVRLYTLPNELERLRKNSLSLIQSCHTFESRWANVEEFLHL